MAENLESGVYSADWQQKNTARQIITEADRLTQRVEEVLTLSKAPALTRKEPFNLEEVCYELIELWGLDSSNMTFGFQQTSMSLQILSGTQQKSGTQSVAF